MANRRELQEEKKSLRIQTFGRKKNAIANAVVKVGNGLIKVNGYPLELVEPSAMRVKVFEPIIFLGPERFRNLDIRVRVRGGGQISQIYAIRQAISRGIVAFMQKKDEQQKRQIKEMLMEYDKQLLVSDPRRKEPKKFGGKGARRRKQLSFR